MRFRKKMMILRPGYVLVTVLVRLWVGVPRRHFLAAHPLFDQNCWIPSGAHAVTGDCLQYGSLYSVISL